MCPPSTLMSHYWFIQDGECVWCSSCESWVSLTPAALTYCTKRCKGKEEGKEALYRKRKVLHLVSQWSVLYKDFLREEEHVKLFMKVSE